MNRRIKQAAPKFETSLEYINVLVGAATYRAGI